MGAEISIVIDVGEKLVEKLVSSFMEETQATEQLYKQIEEVCRNLDVTVGDMHALCLAAEEQGADPLSLMRDLVKIGDQRSLARAGDGQALAWFQKIGAKPEPGGNNDIPLLLQVAQAVKTTGQPAQAAMRQIGMADDTVRFLAERGDGIYADMIAHREEGGRREGAHTAYTLWEEGHGWLSAEYRAAVLQALIGRNNLTGDLTWEAATGKDKFQQDNPARPSANACGPFPVHNGPEETAPIYRPQADVPEAGDAADRTALHTTVFNPEPLDGGGDGPASHGPGEALSSATPDGPAFAAPLPDILSSVPGTLTDCLNALNDIRDILAAMRHLGADGLGLEHGSVLDAMAPVAMGPTRGDTYVDQHLTVNQQLPPDADAPVYASMSAATIGDSTLEALALQESSGVWG